MCVFFTISSGLLLCLPQRGRGTAAAVDEESGLQITILVSASIITISLSWLQILHPDTNMLQNILAYRIESFMNILI